MMVLFHLAMLALGLYLFHEVTKERAPSWLVGVATANVFIQLALFVLVAYA